MIPLEPGEFIPTPVQELDWVQSFQNPNCLLLLAEHNGKLIGNIDLTGSSRRKMFHTAEVGMSVRKEWRGKGIGKELLKHAINWANGNTFLEVLWLQVYEDNTAARKLYESMGFEVSGKQANFFHEKRGRIANIIMTLQLKKDQT
jgi:ribosomal protein S18 acetylase RimI-like enzyme